MLRKLASGERLQFVQVSKRAAKWYEVVDPATGWTGFVERRAVRIIVAPAAQTTARPTLAPNVIKKPRRQLKTKR